MVTMTIYYWEVPKRIKSNKNPSGIVFDHTLIQKINKCGNFTNLDFAQFLET